MSDPVVGEETTEGEGDEAEERGCGAGSELPPKKCFRLNPYRILRMIIAFNSENFEKIQARLNKFICKLTDAETVFFMLSTEEEGLVKVQVVGSNILPMAGHFFIGNSCFDGAVESQCPFFTDSLEDCTHKILSYIIEKPVVSFLCYPLVFKENPKYYLLLCLANRKVLVPAIPHPTFKYARPNTFQKGLMNIAEFTEKDLIILDDLFYYLSPILFRTFIHDCQRHRRLQIESMLELVQNLIIDMHRPSHLVKDFMLTAKTLTKAEGCHLYLVDEQSSRISFKFCEGPIYKMPREKLQKITIPKNKGLVGTVASKGMMFNVTAPHTHPLYNRMYDSVTSINLKNILLFPIKYRSRVVAVGGLCNKTNGNYFNSIDRYMTQTISKYCGICIFYSMRWKSVRETRERMKITNELMIYHMGVKKEEITELVRTKEKYKDYTSFHAKFKSFFFSTKDLDDSLKLPASLFMFTDLGLVNHWNVPLEILAKFMLYVRKSDRNPPYHNWNHVFSAAHFAYLLLGNLQDLQKYLEPIERYVFLVAAFCHDLDHRGTDNSFQITKDSELAALYSSEGSILQAHHFNHAISILNTGNCNIFEMMSRKMYGEALDILNHIILSTDIVRFFSSMDDIKAMISGGVDPNNTKHRHLLLTLMIVACDINEQVKEWNYAFIDTKGIYEEFFAQSEMEKTTNEGPKDLDRQKILIPDLQLTFFETVISPVFELMADLFSELQPTLKQVKKNKSLWEKMKNYILEQNPIQKALEIYGNQEIINKIKEFDEIEE